MVPAALLVLSLTAHSQSTGDPRAVVFRVDVVSRTAKAVNFHHRQGSTVLTLEGSSLAPKAKGEVKVDSKTGATKIEANIERMPPASSLAEGYLTYVLWAITPEGRAENLGEIMLDGDHARLQAATELQSFGMIITAEPYYAVTQPSDYIVAEAVVKNGSTAGTIMPIDAKYELVSRGGYLQSLPAADRVRLREAKNIPLDLMEARQAMAVARAAGAEKYAADTLQKANVDMGNAEAMLKSKQDKKKVQTLARHVTQLSEDARLISVRKARDEALAAERAANERRANELAKEAENEAARRRQAEADVARKNEEAAQARREAERIAAQNAAALAEKDRQLALEAERARTAAAVNEAERLRQQMKERELELQATQAREAAQRAEAERVKMRAELVRQLNVILATRETARGLIVNMSDVLFDTGRYSLRPGAREKLAKIAGIILAHPGLKIEVEGHTDITGGPAINQPLSENRASAVRTYLISQGVEPGSITARGFGENNPVADNATAAGRQANRRVELVVSGPRLTSSSSESNATAGQR
jgi:outer membrane protein OmpA-like peptidoglycan-associated protein